MVKQTKNSQGLINSDTEQIYKRKKKDLEKATDFANMVISKCSVTKFHVAFSQKSRLSRLHFGKVQKNREKN